MEAVMSSLCLFVGSKIDRTQKFQQTDCQIMEEKKVIAPASLYGIQNSNRIGIHLWGKNQFNSSLPAALACWMRDHKINPAYISLKNDLTTSASDVAFSFDYVFNTKEPTKNLGFHFETAYDP